LNLIYILSPLFQKGVESLVAGWVKIVEEAVVLLLLPKPQVACLTVLSVCLMPLSEVYSATTVDERDLFCDVVLVYLWQNSDVIEPSLTHDRLKLRNIALFCQLDRLAEFHFCEPAFNDSIFGV
jgi:hypothetical protein